MTFPVVKNGRRAQDGCQLEKWNEFTVICTALDSWFPTEIKFSQRLHIIFRLDFGSFPERFDRSDKPWKGMVSKLGIMERGEIFHYHNFFNESIE